MPPKLNLSYAGRVEKVQTLATTSKEPHECLLGSIRVGTLVSAVCDPHSPGQLHPRSAATAADTTNCNTHFHVPAITLCCSSRVAAIADVNDLCHIPAQLVLLPSLPTSHNVVWPISGLYLLYMFNLSTNLWDVPTNFLALWLSVSMQVSPWTKAFSVKLLTYK